MQLAFSYVWFSPWHFAFMTQNKHIDKQNKCNECCQTKSSAI